MKNKIFIFITYIENRLYNNMLENKNAITQSQLYLLISFWRKRACATSASVRIAT
jgi:anti-sigma-K factor RskA